MVVGGSDDGEGRVVVVVYGWTLLYYLAPPLLQMGSRGL